MASHTTDVQSQWMVFSFQNVTDEIFIRPAFKPRGEDTHEWRFRRDQQWLPAQVFRDPKGEIEHIRTVFPGRSAASWFRVYRKK